MTTGERIKQCRKRLTLSAEKLAFIVGVSPATIYRWEKGDIEKVPGYVLEPLADALQTTPAYLAGWGDEQTDCSTPLSTDESALVTDYRQLSPDGKTYIRQTMAMAVHTYGKNNAVPGMANQA